jgi:hypothetical protein
LIGRADRLPGGDIRAMTRRPQDPRVRRANIRLALALAALAVAFYLVVLLFNPL